MRFQISSNNAEKASAEMWGVREFRINITRRVCE